MVGDCNQQRGAHEIENDMGNTCEGTRSTTTQRHAHAAHASHTTLTPPGTAPDITHQSSQQPTGDGQRWGPARGHGTHNYQLRLIHAQREKAEARPLPVKMKLYSCSV